MGRDGFEHQHAQGRKETGKAAFSPNASAWHTGLSGSQYNPRRSSGLLSGVSMLSTFVTRPVGWPPRNVDHRDVSKRERTTGPCWVAGS